MTHPSTSYVLHLLVPSCVLLLLHDPSEQEWQWCEEAWKVWEHVQTYINGVSDRGHLVESIVGDGQQCVGCLHTQAGGEGDLEGGVSDKSDPSASGSTGASTPICLNGGMKASGFTPSVPP